MMTKERALNQNMKKKAWPLLGFATLLIANTEGLAQIQLDGSMGQPGELSGSTINIEQSMGQTRGQNLFHSFDQFSINQGQTVNFNSSNINNIVARVTGRTRSNLNGELNANANFYLMNPNGIVVGRDASMNVNGQLVLTSADYLEFGPGEVFHKNINENSSLSVSPPSAFGFLNDSMRTVTLENSRINLEGEQSLAIVSGRITLNGSVINVDNGDIQLVANNTVTTLATENQRIITDNITEAGDIILNDASYIEKSSENGGGIFIKGGNILMEDNSIITSRSRGSNQQSSMQLDAEVLTLRHGSTISSSGRDSANGATIEIEAGEISIRHGMIMATTYGSGNAGDILIDAENITLEGTGNNNRISRISTNPGAYSSDSTGENGDIVINARNLSVIGGADISTYTLNEQNAGHIAIYADSAVIDKGNDQSNRRTGIGSYTAHEGNAGDIHIEAQTLDLIDESISSRNNFFSITEEAGISEGGASGDIMIISDEININQGNISVGAFGLGSAGNIHIEASNLTMDNRSNLYSGTELAQVTVESGDITLNVSGKTLLSNDSSILSYTSDANSGDVTIYSGEEFVMQGSSILSYLNGDEAPNDSKAGDISITTKLFSMDNYRGLSSDNSRITSSTYAAGNGGTITINAENIQLDNQAEIESFTLAVDYNTGKAGNIILNTGNARINNNSRITTQSVSITNADGIAGDAGNITINAAEDVRFSNGSSVSAESSKAGGGNITIDANEIIWLDTSKISTRVYSENNQNNGGNIDLRATAIIINDSQLLAGAVEGTGGTIQIDAELFYRSIDSDINNASDSGKDGKLVFINPMMNAALENEYFIEPSFFSNSVAESPCAARKSNISLYIDKAQSLRSPFELTHIPGYLMREQFKNKKHNTEGIHLTGIALAEWGCSQAL